MKKYVFPLFLILISSLSSLSAVQVLPDIESLNEREITEIALEALDNDDYPTALKYLRKAAENGYYIAQANLGIMYEEGLGVDENPGEAAKWYKEAAKADEPNSLNRLGLLYEYGNGVEQLGY